MRILIGVAMAVMFGCAAPWEDAPQGAADQTAAALSDEESFWPVCPDRPDCGDPNGTGVYFQEGGRAAMDPIELMIVQFVNVGASVDVVGRYRTDTGVWEFTRGHVEGVLVAGAQRQVLSMRASGTIPTWTITQPSAPGFVDVTDTGLLNLRLVLSFPISNSARLYTFWLSAHSIEVTTPSGPAGVPRNLYKYQAVYQPIQSVNPPVPIGPVKGYCVDANKQLDPVVFQEGITVHPVYGSVSRASSANVVTLSCRKGAIATVFSWGYPYLGIPGNTFYFDSGIHMKRASYCGNAAAYTENGVQIWFRDDKGINNLSGPVLEAWWTPTRALCLGTPRRPAIAAAFPGSCPLLAPSAMPSCNAFASPAPPWLKEGPQ